MALWLWLRFFLMLFVLNVSIQHAEPTKLRLKKGKTQAAGEKKAHLFVPVPINFEGTRTVEHRCMMPVPVGNAENVLYLHIHEDNPCNNGGLMRMERECVFRCLCPPPYGGSLCQDHLYCYCNPCKNGGSCEDIENGFRCQCKDGFTGYSCEERNYCKPNPCSHHATCVEGTSGFKCICKEGYKGDECKEVDPCFPNPCRNNGVCRDIKGVATCECKPPFKGTFCSGILICYHNPCHHNGVCVENPKRPCICKKGFIGKYCEDHVCNPNPCVNGGTCRVLKSHGYHRWIFKCFCPPGFTGTLCHIPHPCSVNVCLNGGTCIDAHADELEYESSAVSISPAAMDFFCQCIVGYTGKKCESMVCDLCDKNAECINNHCVCKTNFTGNGFYCKEIDDPCKPNPCKNNGVCVLGPDGSYTCNCATGYCGAQCEFICNPCASNPCRNGGTCKLVGGSYVCVCLPGFTGPQCGTSLPNPCDSKPCVNGGTCEPIPDKNDYRCLCKGKFTGKNCEECDCPKAKPLKKVVALDQKCDAEGECYCPPYKGEETIYVPGRGCLLKGEGVCQSNPCKNGGTCKTVGTQANVGYVCQCHDKYYGKNCECTECTCNSPCLNNGICQDIDTHVYKCTCPTGFTGANCEVILPTIGPLPCQSNPCVNGGTCVGRHVGYDCLCKAQFTGPHCEVDKCKECDVNADCIYGTCRCRKGYIGTGYVCEKEDNECENVECPIHHHCIQGLCVCLSGYAC